MNPNKTKNTVHIYHWSGDIVVRISKSIAILLGCCPRVSTLLQLILPIFGQPWLNKMLISRPETYIEYIIKLLFFFKIIQAKQNVSTSALKRVIFSFSSMHTCTKRGNNFWVNLKDWNLCYKVLLSLSCKSLSGGELIQLQSLS